MQTPTPSHQAMFNVSFYFALENKEKFYCLIIIIIFFDQRQKNACFPVLCLYYSPTVFILFTYCVYTIHLLCLYYSPTVFILFTYCDPAENAGILTVAHCHKNCTLKTIGGIKRKESRPKHSAAHYLLSSIISSLKSRSAFFTFL
jgi:hypothetical protein